MKKFFVITFVIAVTAIFPSIVLAQTEPPLPCHQATLPSNDPKYPADCSTRSGSKLFSEKLSPGICSKILRITPNCRFPLTTIQAIR